jgi:MinD-like ATPase involved in chromosome partitioning or flagellar assembly
MSEYFIFHGVDHKVGTTMIALSVAEAVAERQPEKRVLLLALNGRESTEYVREGAESVDALRSRLESRLLGEEELIAHCLHVKNLSVLGGVVNEEEERYYMPEAAAFLLDVAGRAFDLVVADSGNRLDNGLAFGALAYDVNRFLVLTQQETALTRWEKRRVLYERLGVMPKAYILNNYIEKDICPADYVARRFAEEQRPFHRVRFVQGGRRAEIERKSLWVSAAEGFKDDVAALADALTGEDAGAPAPRRRRRSWKSFI